MPSLRRLAFALALVLTAPAVVDTHAACLTSTHSVRTQLATSYAAVFDTTLYDPQYAEYGTYTHIDAAHDSLKLNVTGQGTTITSWSRVDHHYRVVGVPDGTPVRILVKMRMRGTVRSSIEDTPVQASGMLSVADAAPVYHTQSLWWSAFGAPAPGTSYDTTLTVSTSVTAGQDFLVSFQLSDAGFFMSANNKASLRYWLPAGVSLVSCTGDTVADVNHTLAVDAPPRAGTRFVSLAPNPARGVAQARVSVDAGVPASLVLYDLAGRTIERHAWTPDAAGERTLTLGERARLAPGTYFARLTQGATSVARRVVVIE